MKIQEIYSKLEKKYKKQRWWPTISNNKKFEICVGAILTQNINWSNVEKSIKILDKFNFLRRDAIKQLKEEELGQLIKSSGYFRQKARKLKAFVDFLDSGKEINRDNLLGVWGIGRETADSILLYAYNKPTFVIDAYTMRIMKRIGFKFRDYDELQKIFLGELTLDYKLFNEFHALFVIHGKNVCKVKPDCEKCCLRRNCEYFKDRV